MKHKYEGYLFVVLALVIIAPEALTATDKSLPPWHRPGVASIEIQPEKENTEVPSPESERLRALEEDPEPHEKPRLPSFYRISTLEAGKRDPASEEEKSEYQQYLTADQAIRDAEALLRAGDDLQAQEVLLQAYDSSVLNSARFMLANRLGTYYFRKQDYAAAVTYMSEAYELQPDSPSLAANLAAAYLSTGKTDEAIEKLRSIPLEGIRNRNLLFSVFFNLACAYSLKAEVDTSIESLVKAANIDPASTLTSMGDTQLDGIRDDPRFTQLKNALENFVFRSNPKP